MREEGHEYEMEKEKGQDKDRDRGREDEDKSKEKEKFVEIIVNARPKKVEKEKLSYQDVIEMAYGQFDPNPNVVYTVTYSKGKHDEKGSLVDGKVVMVHKGMVFHVTKTDKS